MKIQENKLTLFLRKLVVLVGFVSIVYLTNLFVNELFGGVNPFVEFSSVGFDKIESIDSKDRIGLGVAYNACKDNLGDSNNIFDFADESYQAWYLTEGRFLIQTKVYSTADSGAPTVANLMCRIMKTEDEEFLATHWEVQGIQVDFL